ncbi:MAG: outer membrane protein assembly factor BamC [Oleiphilaceae bacterium]|nr:outer membrane protein assembly factor BamC [Oleiphilaceae bacterium]
MEVQYKKLLASTLVGIVVLANSACGVIDDRTDKYVEAAEKAPLKTPSGDPLPRANEAYPIRDIGKDTSRLTAQGEVPRPPDSTSEILAENYLIENVEGQTWILVNEVPGQVWPSVSAYMNERGLGSAYESTQLGVIQSEIANFSRRARDLLEMPDVDEGQDENYKVVQARVAPGVRRKTTEIQFRVLELDERPDELLPWPSESEARGLERKLLEDIAVFLKSREDNKSYSRAALDMTDAPKVRLLDEDGRQAAGIKMAVSYERAWGALRRALSEAQIPVVDLDRSGGQFYVDFRSEDERAPNWFGFFAKDPTPEYTFYVRLEEQDDGILVTTGRAEDYDGTDRSQELLSKLFEFLY